MADIAQTPDGYLWLSTTGGLARFDGVRFEVFGPQQGLPSNRFAGLAVGRDGALHASSEDGSLVRWDGRRFTSRQTGLARGVAVQAFPDGSVLLTSSNSTLVAWFGDSVTRVLDGNYRDFLRPIVDIQGRVWTTARSGAPARLEDGRVVAIGPPGGATSTWILDPRDGAPRFFRTLGRDAELLDEHARRIARFPGAGDEFPHLIDRRGRLWCVRGPDLIVRSSQGGLELGRVALGLGAPPNLVFEDQQENIWVGTATQGLMRVTPSLLRLLRPQARTTPLQIVAVRELPDGAILAVDETARPWIAGGDVLRPYPESHEGPWLARFEGTGRTRYRLGLGRIEVRDPEGRGGSFAIPDASPLDVYEDPVTPATAYVVPDMKLLRVSAAPGLTPIASVLPLPAQVRHVFFDRRDRMWVGTMTGLWRIAAGDTTQFTRNDGLPTDHIRQIHEDADGTLWIGTYGGGLVRWKDNRFATLTRAQGLMEDVVSVVLEDGAGHLWLAGNRGIQRLSRAQANACLDGLRPRVETVGLGTEAGLLNPEGSGQPGLRSRDGRLWFPTFDGLAVVDPTFEKALASSPPIPKIEAVLASDREVKGTDRGFVLAPGLHRFTIRYTGIDLRAPEQVRFRYQLEGFDQDWVDAGGARAATYTNVPPGRYRFRVHALGGTGARTPSPADIVVVLRPHFWQTRPFQALLLAVIALGVVVGWRRRSRRLLARAAELQRAVEDRTSELVDEKSRTEVALATVEAQAQRLAALDRARSSFFASISHEFRTPLTLIQGPLQDVREGLHGTVRPDAREQIGIALDSAGRLHRLVDQLLDAARAEAGKLRLQRRPGDLVAFLDELAQSFSPLAERKRIAFRRTLPDRAAIASLDPQALEKVFANLLGNAFKFTPEGGNVVLSAVRVEGDPPLLEVMVSDDGPGIAAEDLPHVFERFYRSERSSTRAQPGTGLGLALARDMVGQHGGTIAVASREGVGSTFTVRLPLMAVGAVMPVTAPAPEGSALAAALMDEIRLTPQVRVPDGPSTRVGDVPTVLVVEDHPEVRAYVGRRLWPHYRVVEAADGEQALALMRLAPPDLVVSDLAMPVMDGLALCRAIREDPELEFVPVILLSASASAESRVAGIDGGADDYLTKPFDAGDLLARVGQLLRTRRRLRERLARQAAAAVVYGHPGDAAAASRALSGQSAADTAFVRRLREVIESRMGDEDFDVERLAEAMGMGRTLLYQKAAELVSRTPNELIFDHRLERAAGLLAEGEGGVGEIAYAVGFQSVSHFTNRFRERFGVTPSAWKRGERPGPGAGPTHPAHEQPPLPQDSTPLATS